MRCSVVLALLVALPALPQTTPDARLARIERGLRLGAELAGQPAPTFEIRERMKHYNVPAVSIAVLDNGKLLFARGYGEATPETLFQAASISKPVAAMVAMRLVEQGELSLDDDVAPRLKSWKIPASAVLDKEKITLRRLLSHTAGTTVHGFRGYAEGEAVPTLVQLLNGQTPANSKPVVPDLLPGSQWRYSGGGYEIAQLLIEEATGKPFAEVARELVLEPLRMTHSTYAQPLPEPLRAKAATGYRSDGKPVAGRFHTYPEQAAAGLWTTPSDLLLVAREIQSGGTLLKSSSVTEMLKPILGNYGIGFSLANTKDQSSFSHGGANEGFRCNLFAYREGGRAVAIMTNGDRGGQLATEILRAVAIEFDWPDYRPTTRTAVTVSEETLSSYAGIYAFEGGPTATITIEKGRLFLAAQPVGRVELFAESPTRFFALEGGAPPLTFGIKDGATALTAGAQTAKRQPLK